MKLLFRYVLHMASIEKDGPVSFKVTRPLFVPWPLFCRISLKSPILFIMGTSELSVLSLISYIMPRSEDGGWCYTTQGIGKLREKSPKWSSKSFFPTYNFPCLVEPSILTWLWHCFFPEPFWRLLPIPRHRALRTLLTYSKQTNHGN